MSTIENQSDAEFVQARRQLAAIVESADDAIVSKRLDGTITSWNAAAERMFGYKADEAVGRSILLIVPPELIAEEEEIIRRLKRGERIEHRETIRTTKAGERIPVSLTISPIRDEDGNVVGASKIARDIRERKQVEDERERLLGVERAARRTAEEASRVKDEFLATLSHELRNPLNAIVGWTALLRSCKLGPEESERAWDALERSTRAEEQLISDLLDVSRIISGKLRLDIRAFELANVVEAAIDVIRPAAQAKNMELQQLLDPAAGPVTGDPARLQQVCWNLLSNAIKFTPKGGRVQVVLRRLDSHAEITVSDTGVGIAREFLPHVFERFTQQDASPTREHGGLGLGLAIVKQLVELHGGSVRADSAGEGAGTTITVRLPIMPARLIEDRAYAHPAAGASASMLVGVRVLVVEDEPGARQLIAAILNSGQAEVRTAAGGNEALSLMDSWLPDVLLSDIGMPHEDGYTFIRKVRDRPAEAGGHVPAAALTAYARAEDRLRILSAGYQIHVAKPILPAELLAVVASLARFGRGRAPQGGN